MHYIYTSSHYNNVSALRRRTNLFACCLIVRDGEMAERRGWSRRRIRAIESPLIYIPITFPYCVNKISAVQILRYCLEVQWNDDDSRWFYRRTRQFNVNVLIRREKQCRRRQWGTAMLERFGNGSPQKGQAEEAGRRNNILLFVKVNER